MYFLLPLLISSEKREFWQSEIEFTLSAPSHLFPSLSISYSGENYLRSPLPSPSPSQLLFSFLPCQ